MKAQKSAEEEEIHVANIEFAFLNYELIELLKERGTAITNLEFDKIKEYDQKISEMVKFNEMREKLIRPVCAFITFETDDGKNEAIAFSKKKSWWNKSNEESEGVIRETIFNTIPHFKQATEPTNIIWENRHIKGVDYAARVVGVLLIITFMLFITFTIIFSFKKYQIENTKKWPMTVNCDE